MKKTRSIRFGSILIDLVIDFALMGTGFLIYYHFMIQPLAPVGLNPGITELLGGLKTAVLLIAGLPFALGLFNLVRTILHLISGMAASIQR
jgi:hypothetical protein